MLWIILTLLAALAWSITAVVSKHVLDDEIRDPLLAATIFSTGLFLSMISISLVLGDLTFSPKFGIGGITIGILYGIGIWLYYKALRKKEVSRFLPLLSFSPIFVLPVAFFLFNESFSLPTYIGIFSIIGGSILISLKREHKKLKLTGGLFIALGSALFFAFRNVLIKYLTLQVEFLSLAPWIGIGSGLFSVILILTHHPHLRSKSGKGIEHMLLISVLGSFGFLSFIFAISLGPISLAVTLVRTQLVFSFLLATFFSFFHPNIVREEITKSVLLQKAIAIAIVIIGVYLIS